MIYPWIQNKECLHCGLGLQLQLYLSTIRSRRSILNNDTTTLEGKSIVGFISVSWSSIRDICLHNKRFGTLIPSLNATSIGNGMAWLIVSSRAEESERKPRHLVRFEVNLTSGVISFPFSSKAFDMDNVARIDAMAIHTLASATWRPGQILKSRSLGFSTTIHRR
jgi:hypothetical protein